MINKKKKVGAACAAIIVGAGCFYAAIHLKSSTSEEQIYGQKVATITNHLVNVNQYSGIVESQKVEKYMVDSDKKIVETYVNQGDKVNVGDSLFKYDSSEAAQSITNANLEVEGIQQSIQSLRNEINGLNKRLEEVESEEKIQIQSEISDKQLEIRQQEYDIQAKKNELAHFQEEVNQSVVKATISGIVQSVNPDKKEENSQNVYISIIQDENYLVKGTVDEMNVGSLKVDDSVIIRSKTDQNKMWNGKIKKIEMNQEQQEQQTADMQNSLGEQASRYPFYIQLDQKKGLMLGQHVFVEPDVGQKEKKSGIWLDDGFLVKEAKNDYYVWFVDHGKAKKRPVKIGKVDENMGISEIYSGIKKSDYIIWPEDSLKQGQKVQIEE